MRTSRLALAALLPVALPLVVACRTTAPVAGAAYGTPPSAPSASTASPPAPAPPSASPPVSASGAPMIPAKTVLTVKKTKIGYVLATGTGLTLYWFGRDVRGSGKSACTGTCLTSWPALAGQPVAAAGVSLSGKLGTLTRPGGVVQATYNGRPLYRFAADTAAGQTLGNGVEGAWHVITGAALSASPAAAAAASARDANVRPRHETSARAARRLTHRSWGTTVL